MDKERGFDLIFLAVVYALVMLGVFTTMNIVFTSNWILRFNSSNFDFSRILLSRHCLFILAGMLIFACIQFIKFDFKNILSRFEIWLIPAMCLPLLPLLFRGYSMHFNGGTRYFGFNYLWIHTGFWSCVCYLISCAIITGGEEKLSRIKSTLLIIGAAVIGFSLLRQPDLPMLLLLIFIIVSFLLFNNRKGTALIFAGTTCALFCLYLISKHGYEIPRIIGFYNLTDPLGTSYQIIEARKCFKMGGLWGSAVSCMPPFPFDTFFAIFVSKYGFAGIIYFLLLQSIYFVLGFKGASLVKDKTKSLVLKGCLFVFAFLSIGGMAVSANMLPIFYHIPFGYNGTLMIFSFPVAGFLFRALWVNRKEEAGHATYISLLKNKPVICYLFILIIIAVRCAYLSCL